MITIRYIPHIIQRRIPRSFQLLFILFAICAASLYVLSVYLKKVDATQRVFNPALSKSHVLKASSTSFGFQKLDTSKREIDPTPNKSLLPKAPSPTQENVYIYNVRSDSGLLKKNASSPLITILWINKPGFIQLKDPFHDCPYTNCRMTDVVENIKSKSAIVFSTQNFLDVSFNPQEKPRDQVWIFFRIEPPAIGKVVNWFESPIWRNTMNWSWGYRLGSDIFRPYQQLIPRSTYPDKNYSEIFKRKNKVAAWVVSNCRTQSRREEYVQQLKQHGLPVDIYGRCSPNGTSDPQAQKKVNDNYKFYLSFENSFCKDYVTEKFFIYYDLNVVLVARGGFNYSRYFDRTTFINAADFPSAKELADFILKVNSNEVLYTNYLRNKDKYKSRTIQAMRLAANCQLCEKLNHKERYNKVYDNMSDFLVKDACFPPNDL